MHGYMNGKFLKNQFFILICNIFGVIYLKIAKSGMTSSEYSRYVNADYLLDTNTRTQNTKTETVGGLC
jgi:hypothetical protein